MTKRYNLSKIMRRAWELVKTVAISISEGLRKAWKEAKELTDDQKIERLIEAGFKRWQKGNFDRLYINASELGLVCCYYNTGNISFSEFQGNEISHAEAYRMKASKTFIDLKTWKLYSDNRNMERAATELMEKALA